MSKFLSVWGFLDFDQDTDDLKKHSDYLILIQARLNGMAGSDEDKSKSLGRTLGQISDIMNGRPENFSLSEPSAIAKKIGVVARPLYYQSHETLQFIPQLPRILQ